MKQNHPFQIFLGPLKTRIIQILVFSCGWIELARTFAKEVSGKEMQIHDARSLHPSVDVYSITYAHEFRCLIHSNLC